MVNACLVQIQESEQARTKRAFHQGTRRHRKQHVAEQLPPVAVQKHGSESIRYGRLVGMQGIAFTHDVFAQSVIGGPRRTPSLLLARVIEQIATLQAIAKFGIALLSL
nr:hypothetical protein [Pseudomarimonas arenosa]